MMSISNNKKRYLISFLVGILFIPSIEVNAADVSAKRLKVASYEYEPYSMTLADGSFSGIAIDLLNAVLLETGLTADIIFQPWKRSLRDAKMGEADLVLPCGRSKEREEFFLFSDTVGVGTITVLTLKDSPYAGKLNSIESTKPLGNKLGTIAGGYLEGLLTKSDILNPLQVYIESTIPNLLKKGRIEAYLGYKDVLTHIIKNDALVTKNDFFFHNIITRKYGFCISKKAEHAERLNEQLNQGIRRIRANGVRAKILEKYNRSE